VEDITFYMQKYLEAKRGIWNTYFCRPDYTYSNDILDYYEYIDYYLFYALVLHPIDRKLPKSFRYGDQPIPYIYIVPRDTLAKMEVEVCPPSDGNKVYESRLIDFSKQLSLSYIRYFNWDHYGFVTYPYYLTKVMQCESDPEIVGFNLLIETQYCQVKHKKEYEEKPANDMNHTIE